MTEPKTFPEPGRSEASAQATRWLTWLLLAAAIAILIFGAWLRRHSLDDAFINYRIVHQIEAGNGPVFNAHERVEAYSSPLWLVMLVLGDVSLPFPLEWIGMAGGMLLGRCGHGVRGTRFRTAPEA